MSAWNTNQKIIDEYNLKINEIPDSQRSSVVYSHLNTLEDYIAWKKRITELFAIDDAAKDLL